MAQSKVLTSAQASLATPQGAIVAAAVTGLLWHRIYNRNEPTMRSFFRDLFVTLATFILATVSRREDISSLVINTVIFLTTELATLSLSITLYRLFFHPLRKYPGPWYAKLTKWTGAYWASTGKLHDIMPPLHEKYGDVVRVGPNELSFGDASAIKWIYGAESSRLIKGPYHSTPVYGAKGVAMPNIRDYVEHKTRRRMWDNGFTKAQLKSYEPRVIAQIDLLCEQLQKLDGQVVNMRAWMDYVTFDVMGDLALSKSFGMLNDDGPRFYSEAIRGGIRLRNIMAHVPWTAGVAHLLPVNAQTKKYSDRFKALSKSTFQERRAKGTDPDDLFSYILAGNKDGVKTQENDLAADAPILIIAGSDTSSIASALIFYNITSDKAFYSRLRDEIDGAWDGKSDLHSDMLTPNKCPLLNGTIYETLRIWPPGPNHFQRRTFDVVGHQVNGVIIPPETQVGVHVLTVQRSPKNFTRPLDFVPDRWNDAVRDPTWNHNTQAWMPFQLGAYGCIGKQLALNELQLLVAKVVRKFDVIMLDDFDRAGFEDSIQSFQSLIMDPLPLLVKSRNGRD